MNDNTIELRQLWYAASLCQRYADAIAQQPIDQSILLRELSDQFQAGVPADAGLTDLIIHMASAATRASTAYDILDKNAGQEYRNILKNEKLTNKQKRSQLDENFNRFIMHMLRDNIGHQEGEEKWQLRQDFLSEKAIKEVYNAFRISMENLGKLLVKRGAI